MCIKGYIVKETLMQRNKEHFRDQQEVVDKKVDVINRVLSDKKPMSDNDIDAILQAQFDSLKKLQDNGKLLSKMLDAKRKKSIEMYSPESAAVLVLATVMNLTRYVLEPNSLIGSLSFAVNVSALVYTEYQYKAVTKSILSTIGFFTDYSRNESQLSEGSQEISNNPNKSR